MKLNFMSTRFLRILVAAGYLLMCLLAGGIMYLWHYEWKEIEALETENQRINNFRQEIHHVYGEMTGLSLLGESVLEWEDEDLEHYHIRRMAVDSMLCRFKTVYPARQIDSVRHLLESKERLLQGIVEVLDEQESLNQRIAERVPVIAARSAQEQPQKSKRKGFLGLFGKKEKPKTTATTNMLHALNSKEIAQQQAQSRRLAAQTNSLAMRNNKLNRQLQSLIGQMDRKIESDLQGREMEITAMRERSFLQIGSLTGCLFLLLVVSYIIIHRDIRRIIRYKSKTVSLIKQLYESDMQNKELISSRKKAMHTITHELRTPLTAIHGYAELIQGHDTDNISRYAESILQAAGRMIAMLNTLLDFFRLDSGKENANSAPFRLQGMADALLTEFIPLAEAKDLRFTVECCDDVILMGDKERIMQVCGNLLSNAVKFTQSGNVSFRMEYNGSVLSIVVEDTGNGMSGEEQQRVFGAFERLSNAATQDGFGFGIKIFLCKKSSKYKEGKTIQVKSYSNLSLNSAEQVISSIIPWLTIFADELDFMVLFVCIILQCCFIAIASYNNNNYNLLCSIWGYRYYEVYTEENTYILISEKCIRNKNEIKKFVEVTDYMGLIINEK